MFNFLLILFLISHGLNRAATQSSQSLVQKRSMTMTMRKFSAALAVADAPEDPSSSNNPTSTALPVIDATREMDKNPKLNAIVDSIASLSLLEVSNLVTILKASWERRCIRPLNHPFIHSSITIIIGKI